VADIERERMADLSDHWLWVVDDQYVHAPIGADALDQEDKKRGIELPALARAVALNAEGKTVKAVKEVDAAVLAGLNLPELHWTKGQLEFELGHYDESLKAYEQVLQLRPKDKAVVFNIALCLEKLGRFKDAAERYGELTTLAPELWATHLGLGACLLNLGDAEGGLTQFDACLDRNPEHDRALIGKAAALQMLGKYDESHELYCTVLRSHPTDPDLLASLVAVAAARKDEPHLRDYSEKLLEIKPGARAALEGLITAALLRQNYDVAAHYGSLYVKAVPDSYEGWFNLGAALRHKGKVQEAANAYQEASKVRPDGAEALGNLAIILHENEDLERARQAYERVLELEPAHTGTLWNLALLYHRAGNLEGAEKCYGKLVKLQPEWEDAWLRLGYLWLERGDSRSAIEALEKIASKPRPRFDGLVNLAIAYWRTGQIGAVKSLLVKGLQERPNAVEFLRILAVVAVEEQDYDEAVRLEARLGEAGEPWPELSFNIGVLLQKAGRHNDAVQAFQHATKAKPGFGEALLNLGHALKALGQEDKAKQCWRDAVQAMPELAENYFPAA
jgi:tetratricopeptide (TPR) repeat protein